MSPSSGSESHYANTITGVWHPTFSSHTLVSQLFFSYTLRQEKQVILALELSLKKEQISSSFIMFIITHCFFLYHTTVFYALSDEAMDTPGHYLLYFSSAAILTHLYPILGIDTSVKVACCEGFLAYRYCSRYCDYYLLCCAVHFWFIMSPWKV